MRAGPNVPDPVRVSVPPVVAASRARLVPGERDEPRIPLTVTVVPYTLRYWMVAEGGEIPHQESGGLDREVGAVLSARLDGVTVSGADPDVGRRCGGSGAGVAPAHVPGV